MLGPLFPMDGCLMRRPAKHARHPEYDDPCPDGQSSGPGLRIRRSRASLYGFQKIQLQRDSTGFKCSTDSWPPSLWITGWSVGWSRPHEAVLRRDRALNPWQKHWNPPLLFATPVASKLGSGRLEWIHIHGLLTYTLLFWIIHPQPRKA